MERISSLNGDEFIIVRRGLVDYEISPAQLFTLLGDLPLAASALPYTIDIALAASATTDGMDITITVQDNAGAAIAGVHLLELWISEAATGIGLTADTYSGDVTVATGTEWEEIVSKKHYRVLTDANGVAVLTAVDSANPVDQYIAVAHPLSGAVTVSEASGTNWEGA